MLRRRVFRLLTSGDAVVELRQLVRNHDVRFEFEGVSGEELSPRFELLDELHAVFHRCQVFDRASGIVTHCFGHCFDAAASSVSYASDVECVAVVIFDDQVKAAFSLSPVKSHGYPSAVSVGFAEIGFHSV